MVKNGWVSFAVSSAPRMPIVNALSSVTSTHMRTHHHTAARPRPGAAGVCPPVNAPKNSTAAPMPNTVSPLRATPGRSCAVTGSRLFTFSPGTANTSTSASTSISSGRKISEARKSALVLPSAPQTAMVRIVTTNGHGRLSGNTASMNRSAPMRSANAL